MVSLEASNSKVPRCLLHVDFSRKLEYEGSRGSSQVLCAISQCTSNVCSRCTQTNFSRISFLTTVEEQGNQQVFPKTENHLGLFLSRVSLSTDSSSMLATGPGAAGCAAVMGG